MVPEVPYHAREKSVFTDPVGAPSEKPKRIRDVIDSMYPELKKIELFCRGEPANGWDGWGNECITCNTDAMPTYQISRDIFTPDAQPANDELFDPSMALNKEAA